MPALHCKRAAVAAIAQAVLSLGLPGGGQNNRLAKCNGASGTGCSVHDRCNHAAASPDQGLMGTTLTPASGASTDTYPIAPGLALT